MRFVVCCLRFVCYIKERALLLLVCVFWFIYSCLCVSEFGLLVVRLRVVDLLSVCGVLRIACSFVFFFVCRIYVVGGVFV